MQQGLALRHQLVTREQEFIFDYWASLRDGDGHPNRHDLDPSVLRQHLPFISIYERGTDGRFSIRLAGTGFWNFHGEEIQGRNIDDLSIGEGRAYWHRVLDNVSCSGRPLAGATRPFTAIGSGLQQYWMRLPLFGEDSDMVLGFDQFMKSPVAAETREVSPLMRPVFGHGAPLLATA